MAKELNLDIIPAPHIILKVAQGAKMAVEGYSNVWLDIYEGPHIRNKPSLQKMIKVVISSSLDGNKVMLISKTAVCHMFLLPKGWPHIVIPIYS